jgi:hypothetical protein
MAAIPPPPHEEGVIDPFINEGGEGFLSDRGRQGVLIDTGPIAAGKAEGRGAVRSRQGEWSRQGERL